MSFDEADLDAAAKAYDEALSEFSKAHEAKEDARKKMEAAALLLRQIMKELG